MLLASNSQRIKSGKPPIRIRLEAKSIPAFNGALSLLGDGYSSTLAPANRKAWELLDGNSHPPLVDLVLGGRNSFESIEFRQIMELIVDPQTCGPLLLACTPKVASELIKNGDCKRIGIIE